MENVQDSKTIGKEVKNILGIEHPSREQLEIGALQP